MKHTLKYALSAVPLLSLEAAQNAPTCETLMADLERTAASARNVTRTLTMNAGELSHSVMRVVQGESGLEPTTPKQRGQLLPGREGEPGPQSSLPGLTCEGHTLTETDNGYELSLAVADEGNPVDSVGLEPRRQDEKLVPLGYAAGSITPLSFTTALGLTMRDQDWTFR